METSQTKSLDFRASGHAAVLQGRASMAEMPSRLAVEGLTLVRGEHDLISGLSFHLAAGTAVQITGANGSGKTTLLRALAGWVRPEAGRIIWSDRNGPLAERPALAYLGHRNGLKADLTPVEELAFAARLHGNRDNVRILDSLDRVGLRPCADRLCGRLSAGQQRRVALARVLLNENAVWLLDEPLTALDADSIVTFQDALMQHLRRGGMAVLSTHQRLSLATECLRTLALEASGAR
ncbi:MAG: cytochrome c biogenesis heme-transporting ATPase CcmA [Gammaproteobacteria bacterium]|nr:cytochrome c biogenesis heme-transporting ATPase CcmA [Gammaproteobacteria bacterium]